MELNTNVSFEFPWSTSFKDFEEALVSHFKYSPVPQENSKKVQRHLKFSIHYKFNKYPITADSFNLSQLHNNVVYCVPFNEAEKKPETEDAHYYCYFNQQQKKFKFTSQILEFKLHFLIHCIFNIPLSAIKISIPKELSFHDTEHYLMGVKAQQRVNILVSINRKTHVCVEVQDWTQKAIDFTKPHTFLKTFYLSKRESMTNAQLKAFRAFYPSSFGSEHENSKEVLVIEVPKPGSTKAFHTLSYFPNKDIELSFPEERLKEYNYVFAIIHETRKTQGCLNNKPLVLKHKQQTMKFNTYYTQMSFGLVRCLFYNFFHMKSPVCFANEQFIETLWLQNQDLGSNGNTLGLVTQSTLTLVCFDQEEQNKLFLQQNAIPPVPLSPTPTPEEFTPIKRKNITSSSSHSKPSKKQRILTSPTPPPSPTNNFVDFSRMFQQQQEKQLLPSFSTLMNIIQSQPLSPSPMTNTLVLTC